VDKTMEPTMPFRSSALLPWARVCRIVFFAVLAFSAYVGVRFVDRATATMNGASDVFDEAARAAR
jgi:hypothetical protein